jgi:hypothetical protein
VTSPANISTGPTNTYYFVVTAATGTSPYEIESVPSAEVSAFVTATALPSLWAQTVTAGSSVSDFEGVSVASDGSVYAAGDIYGLSTGVTATYDFGNSVISSVTNTGSVLVKYNSSGLAQWAQTVAGSNQSAFSSVSVASDGSVYAAGYIYGTGTYNFGNGVTATGTYIGSNVVLVQYNSSTGVAQWARTLTAGSNVSSFSSVAEASDGSVYAAGYIYGTGTYNFGNGVTAAGPTNGPNLVLVKYSNTGLAQWARTVAGSDQSSFNGVSVASDGLSVYAAGYIAGTGTYDFGNSVISAGTYTNGGSVVLVKYDSISGFAQWAQTVTAGPGDSLFTSVSAVTSDGSVYAAGYIQGAGAYTFGIGVPPITGTSTDGINMVLVKYNSAGVAQWAQTVTAGSTSSENLFGVSVATDGSVYAAGYIDGSDTFNFGNSVTATGVYKGENVVLVKYDSTGAASWAQTVTAASNGSFFAGVSAASGGYVYAAGDISGTGTYNFGNGKTAAGTYAGGNLVLVGY